MPSASVDVPAKARGERETKGKGVPVMIYGRNGFLMTTTTTAACTNCSGGGSVREREREGERACVQQR